MKIELHCPHASYKEGMKIYCDVAQNWCANSYFKSCKGWWALTPSADNCPARKDRKNG